MRRLSSFIEHARDALLDYAGFMEADAKYIHMLQRSGKDNFLVPTVQTLEQTFGQEGKWISSGCNYDCGGRCLIKALVVDGVVVRQKTDDTHPDSPDYPQQRGCCRGRSLRKQIFGADRLKYPLKRKHYVPGGGGQKHLRGIDEWERISWDEALDILASELIRVKKEYGNEAILFPSFYVDPAIGISDVLNHFGGYVGAWGTYSYGSWKIPGRPEAIGLEGFTTSVNDRFDFLNTEIVIMFGLNPAWSSPGNGFYYYLQAKKAGAKFILVDPFYNDSSAALDAQWMPIRPGTDTALLLAVAYVLITEDDPVANPLIDWDFLRRCTVGFDETMMPEGEDPRHNFKDYVLGTYSGQAKTPGWASEICGLPPDRIQALAYELRMGRRGSMLSGYANGRTTGSDALPQVFMTVGAMTGHFGKPGHNCGASCHRQNLISGPLLYKVGSDELPHYGESLFGATNGRAFPIRLSINTIDLWDAVLTGKAQAIGKTHAQPGFGSNTLREFDFRIIFNFMGAALETSPNATKGIEAYRKVDFVVSCAQYPSGNAQYSDLILPITTFWEDIGSISEVGTRETLISFTRVVEPLFEAKSTRWIAVELMKKLGMDTEELFPFGEKQAYFNKLKNTCVLDTDGKTYVPLLTITQSDIRQWGVEGRPQEGKIPLQEFLDRGAYQLKLRPGDAYQYIAYEDFVRDPQANPRPTSSGRFEIYSKKYAGLIGQLGIDEKSPLPVYTPRQEGYEATFADWDMKVKGDYPYQIYSIHYMGRAHTNFANNPWVREAFPAPVYMSARDAAELSIQDGDTVLLQSKYGKTLRRANVTVRMIPGVMAIPHGSWIDMDETTGIDMGGNENILCGSPPGGQGTAAYNSMLVNVRKWTGDPLVPDNMKPLRILP